MKLFNTGRSLDIPAQHFAKLFCYLLFLTGIFLLIEISFFIQSTQLYFHDFNFISKHIAIPSSILPDILFFMGAQLLVHVGYAVGIWLVAVSFATAFKCTSKSTFRAALGLWLLGIFSVFIANQYCFPNSKFSALSSAVLPEVVVSILFFLLSSWWILLLSWMGFACLRALGRPLQGALSAMLIILIASTGYQSYFAVTEDASSVKKPNIVIIGVDSLRPDFIGSATQFFTPFLQQATVFSQAFTPLARTFPSWMGILSGLYPKESGIRFNLAPRPSIAALHLLSTLLREQGYKTIFATDETQFSNIDRDYDFDEAITPPIGLNDFLLGTFNDFPLSNLLTNTWLGHWLFPHSYANRPSYMTYNPDSFLSLLRPHLKKSRQQPLFLAVHFCLTHHPYLWGSHSGLSDKEVLGRYQAAIGRVDQQLHDFLTMLNRYQVLQHAVVVLLSDHGEALELKGDRITAPQLYMAQAPIPRFYPPSADQEAVDQSAGHGTDVLGFSQYHTLLAFRLYGLGKQAVRVVSSQVMLLDIKPTLLHFLGLANTGANKSSGLSLRALIQGEARTLPERRGFFLETDFSPEAVRSAHPETRNLVFEGIELFSIDPQTTRVVVKKTMGKMIISSKQYALVDHDWVLALYPQAKGKMTPVLVHRPSGKWTTDLSSSFAQHSPQKKMLLSLRNFYGNEIGHVNRP